MGLRIVVVGAGGRMGRRLVALAIQAGDMAVVGAVEAPGNSQIGQDAGLVAGIEPIHVPIQSSFPADEVDVVLDFSSADAIQQTVEFCNERRAALVLGTTGLGLGQQTMVEQVSGIVPVVWASNMSVGMNVVFAVVGKLAAMLGPGYDIEIVEAHHRFKKDAPSGSAMTVARQICDATDRSYPDVLVHGRQGKEVPRSEGSIGMHAIRAGDITGVHTVIFGGIGETLTISHTAHSRDTFASGALRAARWVVSRKPGLYTMQDVLGIG